MCASSGNSGSRLRHRLRVTRLTWPFPGGGAAGGARLGQPEMAGGDQLWPGAGLGEVGMQRWPGPGNVPAALIRDLRGIHVTGAAQVRALAPESALQARIPA